MDACYHKEFFGMEMLFGLLLIEGVILFGDVIEGWLKKIIKILK